MVYKMNVSVDCHVLYEVRLSRPAQKVQKKKFKCQKEKEKKNPVY